MMAEVLQKYRDNHNITKAQLGQAKEIMREVVMPLVEIAVKEGNRPFAAALLSPQGDIYVDYNRTGKGDPTAHAETLLIGQVCKKNQNPSLKDHTMIINAEPCPQCMTSIMRSDMERIVYGAAMESEAVIPISAKQMKELVPKSRLDIISGILGEETQTQLDRLKQPDPWIRIGMPLISRFGNEINVYQKRAGFLQIDNGGDSSWYEPEEVTQYGNGVYQQGVDVLTNVHFAARPYKIGPGKPRLSPRLD